MARRKSEIEIQYSAANADFNKAIKEMDAEVRTMNKRFNLQKEQMADTATQGDKLAAQIEFLKDKYVVGEEKIKKMRDALDNSIRVYGESSDEAKRWGDRMLDAQTANEKLKNQIAKTDKELQQFNDEIDKMDDSKAPSNLKGDIDKIGDSADGTKGAIGDWGDAFKGILTGGAIGGIISGVSEIAGAVGEVVSSAMEAQTEVAKIGFTTGLEGSDLEEITKAVRGVKTYGIDAEEALEGVRTQIALNKEATKEQNDAFIENAAAISTAYSGIDFEELIREGNEIAEALGTSDENALGLVNRLLQIGFPAAELDIIAEYGTQLAEAGYSAEEIQAIFEAGLDTGTFNIDNLLDGLKEGRIKIIEYGTELPKSMEPLLEKAGLTADEFQNLAKAVAEGGPEGKKAFEDIAAAVGGMTDKTAQAELGVQLYSTKWEDQGPKITEAIQGASDKTVDLAKNTDDLNASVDKLKDSAAIKFSESMAEMEESMLPVKIGLAEMATSFFDVVGPVFEGTTKQTKDLEETIAELVKTGSSNAEQFGFKFSEALDGTITVLDETGTHFRNFTDEEKALWEQNAATAKEKSGEINLTTRKEYDQARLSAERASKGIADATKTNFDKAARDASSASKDIKNDLDGIKNKADKLKWKIPKPSIPQFSLQGSLSLQNGTVPRIQTVWNAKGGYMDTTTLIGMGEAGAEGIVPLEGKHMLPFADAVAERITNTTNATVININAKLNGPQDYEELGRTIDRHLNNQSHEIRIKTGR